MLDGYKLIKFHLIKIVSFQLTLGQEGNNSFSLLHLPSRPYEVVFLVFIRNSLTLPIGHPAPRKLCPRPCGHYDYCFNVLRLLRWGMGNLFVQGFSCCSCFQTGISNAASLCFLTRCRYGREHPCHGCHGELPRTDLLRVTVVSAHAPAAGHWNHKCIKLHPS